MVKYSRQREAIRNRLAGRLDHPTAETLYAELKNDYPNLSLATVYRNLKQMAENGEIGSISTESATRYDPNTMPHSHFFCRKCGCVLDIDEDGAAVARMAQGGFGGVIESCSTNYYGVCPQCSGRNS